jgi:Flp pilus assembly protein TadB
VFDLELAYKGRSASIEGRGTDSCGRFWCVCVLVGVCVCVVCWLVCVCVCVAAHALAGR